jgi:hypothetical protein
MNHNRQDNKNPKTASSPGNGRSISTFSRALICPADCAHSPPHGLAPITHCRGDALFQAWRMVLVLVASLLVTVYCTNAGHETLPRPRSRTNALGKMGEAWLLGTFGSPARFLHVQPFIQHTSRWDSPFFHPAIHFHSILG